MSLLKQDIEKKEQVKKISKLDTYNKNNQHYIVEVIWDNVVYGNRLESCCQLGFLLPSNLKGLF